MASITKDQYDFALAKVEELLPQVDDNTPADDPKSVELVRMSEIVIQYEKEHDPIPFVSPELAAKIDKARQEFRDGKCFSLKGHEEVDRYFESM